MTEQQITRQAFVVLGMHRSGTSATSGTLTRLGISPPKNLMQGSPSNERGYYESRKIAAHHDELLREFNGHWSDWAPFDLDSLDGARREEHLSRLRSLVDEEYDDAATLLIKDPRISRFFPLWRDALEQMALTPRVIIPVRSPLEVSASLAKRDGIDTHRAILMWLRHNLDAEFYSRGLPRAVVKYADLLSDWRSTAQHLAEALRVEWPREPASVAIEMDEFLSQDLRHHVSRDQGFGGFCHAWLEGTDSAMARLSADPGDMDAMRALDRVRQELDAAVARFRDNPARDWFTPGELREEPSKVSPHAGDRAWEARNREADLFVALTAERAKRVALEAQVDELSREREDQSKMLAELRSSLRRETARAKEAQNELSENLTTKLAELAILSRLVVTTRSKFAAAEEMVQMSRRESAAYRAELRAAARALRASRSALLAAAAARPWNTTWKKRVAAILSGPTRAAKPGQVLRRSLLFDPDWYLRTYPDVEQRGMDPIQHYLRRGARELRDPSPFFSTSGYVRRYPDVTNSGQNPLVHYLTVGRYEGKTFVAAGGRARRTPNSPTH